MRMWAMTWNLTFLPQYSRGSSEIGMMSASLNSDDSAAFQSGHPAVPGSVAA